jgi:hypothetical protein
VTTHKIRYLRYKPEAFRPLGEDRHGGERPMRRLEGDGYEESQRHHFVAFPDWHLCFCSAFDIAAVAQALLQRVRKETILVNRE